MRTSATGKVFRRNGLLGQNSESLRNGCRCAARAQLRVQPFLYPARICARYCYLWVACIDARNIGVHQCACLRIGHRSCMRAHHCSAKFIARCLSSPTFFIRQPSSSLGISKVSVPRYREDANNTPMLSTIEGVCMRDEHEKDGGTRKHLRTAHAAKGNQAFYFLGGKSATIQSFSMFHIQPTVLQYACGWINIE